MSITPIPQRGSNWRGKELPDDRVTVFAVDAKRNYIRYGTHNADCCAQTGFIDAFLDEYEPECEVTKEVTE